MRLPNEKYIFTAMELPLYFISDIHLRIKPTDEDLVRQAHLMAFMDQVKESGGTLFIVGDLFDFFFEYKYVIPKTYIEVYAKLLELKQAQIDIHYVLGNHDFWTLDFVSEKLVTTVYKKPAKIEISGKKFLITHGDGILSWDSGYRLLKFILHNPGFIWCYRWLHPTIGYWIAQQISQRDKSYEHTPEYNRRVLNDIDEYAQPILANGVDYIVMGHYHQASVKELSGGKLMIIGDWINLFSYGYFDGSKLELKVWK